MKIVVDHRFCGPSTSGNGGYTCGSMAAFVDGPAEVTLRVPPPLGTALTVERDGETLVARAGAVTVAEARPATVDLEVPQSVSFAAAERAASRFAGFEEHPFGSCFVCGPERAPGDGLRIFPGPAADDLVAAPWVPDAALVDPLYVWCALDCPGGFAVGYPATTLLLGRLAAVVERAPRPGERCVVLGWPLGAEGRKRYAGTALVAAGEVIACGRATWIIAAS
jgi:hypothetical protein